MNTLIIEFRKEKRTGIIPLLLLVGILGAAYAFVNFIVRKDTNLPLAPMDVLLTQVYVMIMVLNMFGIIVAACMVYNMEFKGTAIKKMYILPVSVPKMYLCKFLVLTVLLFIAIVLQNMALVNSSACLLLVHPFVVMLKPAVAMSAQPDNKIVMISMAETFLFLGMGLWMTEHLHYE